MATRRKARSKATAPSKKASSKKKSKAKASSKKTKTKTKAGAPKKAAKKAAPKKAKASPKKAAKKAAPKKAKAAPKKPKVAPKKTKATPKKTKAAPKKTKAAPKKAKAAPAKVAAPRASVRPVKAQAAPRHLPIRPEDVRILVVDDEPEVLNLLVPHLGRQGYRISEAEDGDEALEKILTERPNIVLLDVMMPGLNGWEICQYVRDRPELDQVRIIMATGIGSETNAATAPIYGADAYIDKPFRLEDVDRAVRELVERMPGYAA